MRIISNHPAARWFPSRRRFALSKILAFAALRVHCARSWRAPATALTGDRQHLVLAIDHDQDSFEIYSVAALHFAVCTCFIASVIPLPVPFSFLLAAMVEPLLALILCFIIGSLVMPRWSTFRKRDTIDFQHANGMVLMALAIAAAVSLLRQGGWGRPVGAMFLGITALNALSSVAVRLLRNAIAGWEKRCVA